MAHYAFLDENNIVTEVITGIDENDKETLPSDFTSWEGFYSSQRSNATCKRTSFNTLGNVHTDEGVAFRGNYAGIGFTFDETNDVFYAPKPYESWLISAESNWLWVAPLEKPENSQENIDNNIVYEWDEDLYQSDNSKGWILNNE